LIAKLAIIIGMRAGEIFALKPGHIKEDSITIEQRVYRGELDSPKTHRSVRTVALPDGVRALFCNWLGISSNSAADAWVFPSETGKTPLSKDNCWRRCFARKLQKVDLEWINFQVMRRTNSSLNEEQNIDPKVVADQLGHSLGVDLNVYTETALQVRRDAANALESALGRSTAEPKECA
jgi:integrase